MKYKSKIDWWYAGIYVVLYACLFYCIAVGPIWPGMAFGIIILAFLPLCVLLHFVDTYYIFEGPCLRIHSWPFINRRIPYGNMAAIKKVNSFAGGASLSSQQIEIQYLKGKKTKTAYISPKGREEFMKKLMDRVDEERNGGKS